MLKVTVDLHPGGDVSRARCLGTAEIANVGGTEVVGEYAIRLMTAGKRPRTFQVGRVEGFPRKQLGVWDLLLRGLADILNTKITGRRKSIPVPRDWQMSISAANLEYETAGRISAKADEMADAIRAFATCEPAEQERVLELLSGDRCITPSSEASRAAAAVLRTMVSATKPG